MKDDRENLALRVLHATLESSTEEATKSVGAIALGHFLSAAIAGPTAAVVAAVAKSLVGELLKATSTIERKLDLIIAEPFQTAANTVREVLSVKAHTVSERTEFNRRLNQAFDKLDTAYTYASQLRKPEKLLIRLYQALVAALKDGGRPFAQLYVTELRKVVADARARAADFEVQATWEQLSYGDALTRSETPLQRTRLLEKAAQIKSYAAELEAFCEFVTKVSDLGLETLQNG